MISIESMTTLILRMTLRSTKTFRTLRRPNKMLPKQLVNFWILNLINIENNIDLSNQCHLLSDLFWKDNCIKVFLLAGCIPSVLGHWSTTIKFMWTVSSSSQYLREIAPKLWWRVSTLQWYVQSFLTNSFYHFVFLQPHRISVKAVDRGGRTSRDPGCTIVIGKSKCW